MSKIYSNKILIFLAALASFTACKTYYPVTHTDNLEKVTHQIAPDKNIKAFYQPYKDSLDKSMKVQLATLSQDLMKEQPESTLGNMMVDILKAETEKYTKKKIDIAILNYGGIRSSSLAKGPLLIENAYLLMPFDNYLVALNLTGQQIQTFCDIIAEYGGWPVAGISFQIQNKKAINIMVGEQPLDNSKIYCTATIDYVANGGDGMEFLRPIPQIQTGVLYREAIMEYWKEQTKEGKQISASLENRVSYAK